MTKTEFNTEATTISILELFKRLNLQEDSWEEGFVEETVESVLGDLTTVVRQAHLALTDATLVMLWGTYDEYGFGGDADLYLQDGDTLYSVSIPLLQGGLKPFVRDLKNITKGTVDPENNLFIAWPSDGRCQHNAYVDRGFGFTITGHEGPKMVGEEAADIYLSIKPDRLPAGIVSPSIVVVFTKDDSININLLDEGFPMEYEVDDERDKIMQYLASKDLIAPARELLGLEVWHCTECNGTNLEEIEDEDELMYCIDCKFERHVH